MFRAAVLDGIRAGTVTVAFRHWRSPRVLPGTRLRTRIGLVEIRAVEPVSPADVTDDDARRAGSSSAAGLLAAFPGAPDRTLYRIELAYAGEDPRVALRADAGPGAVPELVAALVRMDRTARRGPWTRAVLQMIADRPAVRAPDLAPLLGYPDTLTFKRDVRRLKELGLTESLPVGYRLSPRGEAVLAAL